jgi:hypothetical protein
LLKHFPERSVEKGNFGRRVCVQPSIPQGTNEATMKKVLLIMAGLVVLSATMTSCSKHQSCPAYGKVHKVQPAKQA